MAQGQQNRIFGGRKPQHVIILASGDKVRHMTLRPWMMATTLCGLAVLALGYLLATSYLVLRDDLIGATMARQARMQYDYEDRIAALRAQVDRVTSRQLLDQQVVEQKVDKLMQQQLSLSSRHGKLDALLDRAENSGLTDKKASGADHAELAPEAKTDDLASIETAPDNSTLASLPATETVADHADRVFSKVTLSLKRIEQDQLKRIKRLTDGADETADNIQSIVKSVGVAMPDAATTATPDEDGGVGGPLLPPENVDQFDQSLADLDTALTRLETVRGTVEQLPFRNPAQGHLITSPFGNRADPFLGKLALHPGVDFHFSPGEAIRATAPGKVVTAGWAGGYGNMVEIDHGDGISTRYGHMEQVTVQAGEQVKAGEQVGLAGSTGRSTGTHLHYEVRENGHPIDPMYFVNAGVKLASYIN